jgi:hypothetical protein
VALRLRQRLKRRSSVAVIDPQGDLAEDILDALPRPRINNV